MVKILMEMNKKQANKKEIVFNVITNTTRAFYNI